MSRVPYDWSKLCSDLLRSILERLSTYDFHRARSVCSNWYSVSTTCMRPLYPWKILLGQSSTLLFDPEQHKSIFTEHPGFDFSKSCVIASSSNWLLIIGYRLDLYLLNVFTCERINLPSMGSLLQGQAYFQLEERCRKLILYSTTVTCRRVISACLWMNERTRDYVVAWSFNEDYLFSYKKGDDTWRNLEGTMCTSMAYKNNKLYVLATDDYVKILDLSGDSVNEIVEGNPYRNRRFHFVSQRGGITCVEKKVAVTNSGEVLIVLSLKGLREKRLFYMFKMNVESGDWERVDTLGGDILMFGYGITVRSPIKEIIGKGIKSDSICFMDHDDPLPGADYFYPFLEQINRGVFDLASSTIIWTKTFDESVFRSFWFVPGYV